MTVVIPDNYEDLKKWLEESCNMKIEDHPNQLLTPSGWPYFRVTSWEELREALGNCTVPVIGTCVFSYKNKVSKLDFAEIHDDFLWENEKYRWDLLKVATKEDE